MRFSGFVWASAFAYGIAVAAAACGGDDSAAPTPTDGFDGSAGANGGDSSSPVIDAGAPAPALFRFAHLSGGLGPLDVCYRLGTTDAFLGPVFAPLATSDGGGSVIDASSEAGSTSTPGISFPGLSAYVAAPAAPDFEIAVVDVRSGSCSTPVGRANITLDPGRKLTIAILGNFEADVDASNALQIAVFVDDDVRLEDAGRARFIHAALGGHGGGAYGPLSAAAQTAMVIPLAGEIDPAHAATPSSAVPVVDALGYHASAPIDEGSLRLVELGDGAAPTAPWVSSATSLSLAAHAARTGFIVSDSKGLAVLWCDDDAADAAACTLLRP